MAVSAGLDRSYATVMRQWSPGSLAAGASASHSFTLTKAGLVTIRYEYCLADPASELFLRVDGHEEMHHVASVEGAGSPQECLNYCFLGAGRHTISFAAAGASAWAMSTSAGLDVSYSRALGQWSPGALAADSSASHGFTLSKGGLVAIRYEYCLADAATNLKLFVDGHEEIHLIGAIEGVAQPRQRLSYCFLGAGKHTISFVASGAGAWAMAVSAGLKTS